MPLGEFVKECKGWKNVFVHEFFTPNDFDCAYSNYMASLPFSRVVQVYNEATSALKQAAQERTASNTLLINEIPSPAQWKDKFHSEVRSMRVDRICKTYSLFDLHRFHILSAKQETILNETTAVIEQNAQQITQLNRELNEALAPFESQARSKRDQVHKSYNEDPVHKQLAQIESDFQEADKLKNRDQEKLDRTLAAELALYQECAQNKQEAIEKAYRNDPAIQKLEQINKMEKANVAKVCQKRDEKLRQLQTAPEVMVISADQDPAPQDVSPSAPYLNPENLPIAELVPEEAAAEAIPSAIGESLTSIRKKIQDEALREIEHIREKSEKDRQRINKSSEEAQKKRLRDLSAVDQELSQLKANATRSHRLGRESAEEHYESAKKRWSRDRQEPIKRITQLNQTKAQDLQKIDEELALLSAEPKARNLKKQRENQADYELKIAKLNQNYIGLGH